MKNFKSYKFGTRIRFMSADLDNPLLDRTRMSSPRARPVPFEAPRRSPKLQVGSARHIQMFLHGGEASIVTEQGDYNVHRMVPRFVKYYLNWTRDTFPSVIRLSWVSLMTLFITIKLFTIAMFAAIMKSMDGDHHRECVTNASSYSDFFYFVVHTIFTIGYGSMSPICHWSNMMVTIISFFGMFQTATFTGIFFAKFSMDPRRNFACAFTTKLVGIPPMSAEEASPDEMVRFNFRFVNVFHRRFFKVSCRLFLVEHRMNPVNEQWLTPLVEELHYFDTSAPLEFMSLPIEVCAYVRFSRLVRPEYPGACTPLQDPTPGPLRIQGVEDRHAAQKPKQHMRKWVRHFAPHYRRRHEGTQDTSEPSTPRVQSTCVESDVPLNSEFEMVCILVFTDATTGCEIAVRKSWALADTIWLSQSEPCVKWKEVIHRDEKADKYLVDVTGLDFIDNRSDSVYPLVEAPSPLFTGAMSPANTIAYRLINTMTMPAKGQQTHREAATKLFASTIVEERV